MGMNDVINDCYIEVIGDTPSDSQIKNIADNLPENVKYFAKQWGWYDTEVGDKICRWIDKNRFSLGESDLK